MSSHMFARGPLLPRFNARLTTLADFIVRKVSSEILLTLLAILSVAVLTFEIVAESDIIPRSHLIIIDLSISMVFLLDWLIRFSREKDRGKFFRNNWWELLASIPAYIEPTGILRFVRLAVRLRILFNRSKYFIKHAYTLEVFSLFALIMFGGADLFHMFEYGVNENVNSFFDSIWWAMVTITTVGYGDISPVTTGGRIISMIMMILGIGFLGLTTGKVASYLVRNKA